MAYKKISKPFVFKKCLVDGCEESANRVNGGKRGYCSMHYQRFKKYGDPLLTTATPSPARDFIDKNKNYHGDDCLIWPFHRSPKDGYGRIHEKITGKLLTASRAMCIAAHGEPPTPHHEAAHSCGKGHDGCVNPRHIYWATPKENQGDRVEHGTSNRGEAQWKNKLTRAEILKIRSLFGTMTQKAIADQFGIDQSTVSNIKTRKKWAWLD